MSGRADSSRDPYNLFAPAYDAWQAGYPKPFAEAALPFFEREIFGRRAPDRSLIDLACGTGTFLAHWAHRHPEWRLSGIDRSRAMLGQARQKLTGLGVEADLHHRSMENLSLASTFGVAVCVFDGVNHLTRIGDLRRFFKAVSRCLVPGGFLLFDLNDERAFRRLFSGTWTVEGDRLFVSVSASCRPDGLRGRADFTIFKEDRKCWSRTDLSIEERNGSRAEVEAALRPAALLPLRRRRFDPYRNEDIDTPRTLWICRRIEKS